MNPNKFETKTTQPRTAAHVEAPKVDLDEMAERSQPLLDPGRFAPRNEEELERLARRYYFSMKLPESYYPKKYDDRWTDWAIEQGVARAYIAMLEGDAIGVGPVMSIKHIHVINGVSTMSADLMFGRMLATRVLRRDDFTLKADKTQCEIVIGVLTRKPENRLVIVAKYEDFKHLHNKDNWRNDPEAQLVARAKTRSCKRHAPDLFVGLYSREEMQDMREDVAAGVYDVPSEFVPPHASSEANPTKPAPTTEPAQETPAKPVFDREQREAARVLLGEIRGLVAPVEPEEIEALRGRVRAFDGTEAHPFLVVAWNASGILNPAQVAT
jgi:hypothetical protein